MKRAIFALLFAGSLTAAQWDGTYQDLTVSTQIIGGPNPFNLPGASPVPGFAIWLQSTDRTVTGFRVSVTFRNSDGSQNTVVQVVGVPTQYPMTAVTFLNVTVDQVVGLPTITRMRDGETSTLGGSGNTPPTDLSTNPPELQAR
jgi:hypothetical protein